MKVLYKTSLFVWLFLSAFQLLAQNINYAEYFINTDPGFGNGTAISFTPANDIQLDFNADLSTLDNGFHMLYVRALNDSGWSHVYNHPFTIFAVNANKPDIAYLEYFIDADPGIGQGTEVPVTTGVDQDISFIADLSGLDNGFHTLYVRARDANGNWSHVYNRAFTIFSANSGKPDITYLEYFIDTDPGIGSGTSVPVTPGVEQDITFTADLSGLDNGFHTIYVRARDANGNWSHVYNRAFTIFSANSGKPDITYLEYFIDTDPGIGSGTSVPVTPGVEQDISFTADLSGLDNGFHTIYVRARDANGNWCHVYNRAFTIFGSAALSNIVQLEYFVDNDPGYGLANQVEITESGTDIEKSFVVDLSGYSYGDTHTLFIRAKDENGNWSMVYWDEFVRNQVSATAMPPEGGTVTGEEAIDGDGTATLEATPNAGYDFINWTETYSGTEVSTSLIYEPTITSDTSFYANFQIQNFTISASAAPSGTGTVSGAGNYDYGTTIYMEAEPAEHYKFLNWTEGGIEISTNNPFELQVVNDCTIVANFELLENFEITAEVSPVGAGTVTGAGIYDINTTANLIANPALHYKFVNWTINGMEVETAASYSFVVTQDSTVVANFELLENFEIAAISNPVEGGTITGTGTYDINTIATLIANENTGYEFANWVDGDVTVSTNHTYSFTVVNDCTLVANFNALNEYNIATSANPAEGGTTSGDGAYYEGTSINVTASPESGYYFVNWTENGTEVSENSTYNFTVSENRDLVANFSLYEYTIAASANPENGGSVTGGGNFNYGDMVNLIATPAQYYKFINWTSGGVDVSTSAEFSFTVTNDSTLVANFEPYDYIVTTSSNPIAGGTTTGDGGYDNGETATLTALPADWYNFINWTENGNEVSTESTFSFTVSQDTTLVANFELQTFNITTSSFPVEGGSTSGSGTYSYGEAVTLIATPSDHYVFVNWTEDGNEVSSSVEYDFTVNEDRMLVANFEKETYAIIAIAQPVNGGTISGTGSFEYGQQVNLVPTPAVDYVFVNWTEADTVVTNDSIYTFIAEQDRTLFANFDLDNMINEIFNKDGIIIYPNPVSDEIFIQSKQKHTSIYIYDLVGNALLIRERLNAYTTSVPVYELQQGIYMVRIRIADKIIRTYLFMKE